MAPETCFSKLRAASIMHVVWNLFNTWGWKEKKNELSSEEVKFVKCFSSFIKMIIFNSVGMTFCLFLIFYI